MTSLIFESSDKCTVVSDYDDELCIETYSNGGYLGRGGGFLQVKDVKNLINVLSDWIESAEESDE